jgi:hypothetical protein
MKSINSLSRQLLGAYYRSQPEEVKANYRRAVGLFSSRNSQQTDNQSVTTSRKEASKLISHEL